MDEIASMVQTPAQLKLLEHLPDAGDAAVSDWLGPEPAADADRSSYIARYDAMSTLNQRGLIIWDMLDKTLAMTHDGRIARDEKPDVGPISLSEATQILRQLPAFDDSPRLDDGHVTYEYGFSTGFAHALELTSRWINEVLARVSPASCHPSASGTKTWLVTDAATGNKVSATDDPAEAAEWLAEIRAGDWGDVEATVSIDSVDVPELTVRYSGA
jgi:hypothetical protein